MKASIRRIAAITFSIRRAARRRGGLSASPCRRPGKAAEIGPNRKQTNLTRQ
jgi:hypothetical protein